MWRRGCIEVLQPKPEGGGAGDDYAQMTQVMQELGIALLPPKLAHPRPHFPGDHLKPRDIKDQPRITAEPGFTSSVSKPKCVESSVSNTPGSSYFSYLPHSTLAREWERQSTKSRQDCSSKRDSNS